jgi:hypothetical protein
MRFAFPPYGILLQIGVKCVHKSASRGEGILQKLINQSSSADRRNQTFLTEKNKLSGFTSDPHS